MKKVGFIRYNLWRLAVLFIIALYIASNFILIVALILASIFLFPFPKAKSSVISFVLNFLLDTIFVKIAPIVGAYGLSMKTGKINAKGVIFISNHTSFLDPLFLLSLVYHSGVVMKGKYESWLVIWFLVKVFDFVVVDEDKLEGLPEAIKKASDVLSSGRNLIIFPEGRRSTSGRVLDFKKLAFKLSKTVGAKIVPVSIFTPTLFFSKNQKGIFPPGYTTFELEVFPEMNPSDYRDIETMSAAAHRTISKSIAKYSDAYKAGLKNI